MRLLYLFFGLAILVLIPFFIWGDPMMNYFSREGTIEWLSRYGHWAWLAAILLLMGDLLLPLPATIIMAAVGYLYGPVTGALIAASGSFLAGSAGYWLCRLLGEKTAVRILGQKDYERGKRLSGRIGGWVVVLSRWLPVFPEVIACMAGMARMRTLHFHLALACGSIPLGFTYSFIGSTGTVNLTLAILLSAGIPPVIWAMVRPMFKAQLSERR